MTNVVITISEMSGSSTSRTYTTVYDNVRCILTPARPEMLALYDNAPIGQSYEFLITDGRVTKIKDQSKFVIDKNQKSGFCVGDSFITLSTAQQQRQGGRFVIAGLCYKTE